MMHALFRQHRCAVAGLFVATFFAANASAQTCGLKNHMRLVNRVNSGTAAELRIDTGWITTSPLVSPGNASDSSPLGTSTGSWTATSRYGSLSFSGSASATNAPGNGLFMWCDDWIGGEPKAWFKDRLTVVSSSLPVGTPVTIRATAHLSGSVFNSDSGGDHTYAASFTGGQLNLQWSNANGQGTQDFTVNVGSFIDINGKLTCTLRDYRMLGGTVYSDALSASLDAGITFSVITPGASISWCSGAAYSCPADIGSQGGVPGSDGLLDNNDFIVFINDFFNHNPTADIGVQGGIAGSDGQFDNNDFIVFIDRFFTGC